MQRVITIGSLGATVDTTGTTTAAATTSTTDPTAPEEDTPGQLFVESIPTLLVWVGGAVLLGYAVTRLIAAPRARRRDTGRPRRHHSRPTHRAHRSRTRHRR